MKYKLFLVSWSVEGGAPSVVSFERDETALEKHYTVDYVYFAFESLVHARFLNIFFRVTMVELKKVPPYFILRIETINECMHVKTKY